MLKVQMDRREGNFIPIPISYLIQTANQFACDIYVTDEEVLVNVKHYDEMKGLKWLGYLTFYFTGIDEKDAWNRIQGILWENRAG